MMMMMMHHWSQSDTQQLLANTSPMQQSLKARVSRPWLTFAALKSKCMTLHAHSELLKSLAMFYYRLGRRP